MQAKNNKSTQPSPRQSDTPGQIDPGKIDPGQTDLGQTDQSGIGSLLSDITKASDEGQTYTISELTREFGITTRTIRFYESEGLLSPKREGTHRIFSLGDRVRLKLILRGKRLGFALSEIKEIIMMYDMSPGERGQLETFLERLRERRSELAQKQKDIAQTLSELDDAERRCMQRLEVLKGCAKAHKTKPHKAGSKKTS